MVRSCPSLMLLSTIKRACEWFVWFKKHVFFSFYYYFNTFSPSLLHLGLHEMLSKRHFCLCVCAIMIRKEKLKIMNIWKTIRIELNRKKNIEHWKLKRAWKQWNICRLYAKRMEQYTRQHANFISWIVRTVDILPTCTDEEFRKKKGRRRII